MKPLSKSAIDRLVKAHNRRVTALIKEDAKVYAAARGIKCTLPWWVNKKLERNHERK